MGVWSECLCKFWALFSISAVMSPLEYNYLIYLVRTDFPPALQKSILCITIVDDLLRGCSSFILKGFRRTIVILKIRRKFINECEVVEIWNRVVLFWIQNSGRNRRKKINRKKWSELKTSVPKLEYYCSSTSSSTDFYFKFFFKPPLPSLISLLPYCEN